MDLRWLLLRLLRPLLLLSLLLSLLLPLLMPLAMAVTDGALVVTGALQRCQDAAAAGTAHLALAAAVQALNARHDASQLRRRQGRVRLQRCHPVAQLRACGRYGVLWMGAGALGRDLCGQSGRPCLPSRGLPPDLPP